MWGSTGQGRRGPAPGVWGSVGRLPGSGGLRCGVCEAGSARSGGRAPRGRRGLWGLRPACGSAGRAPPGQPRGRGIWPLLPLAGLGGLRGRAGSGRPGVPLRPRAALWPLRLKRREVTVLAIGRPVTLGPRSRPGFPGGGVAGTQPRCPTCLAWVSRCSRKPNLRRRWCVGPRSLGGEVPRRALTI